MFLLIFHSVSLVCFLTPRPISFSTATSSFLRRFYHPLFILIVRATQSKISTFATIPPLHASSSSALSFFSFVSSLRLSPLSIPYHWLNARRDERGPNVAFPEDRALPPSFTRFPSPCKRSIVPLLSSLNLFVRSSCTRTHAPHLPLILSFDPHRTFPRKFSSISRVGYILFRSTSRAPVLCPCFSLPPVPTPVHPCFSQRSSRFVGLNPLRVLTLSRIVLAWSTRLSSPSFLPVPVAPPPFSFAPLAWPERRFLFVAVLRGSTTTEKRTALFVWRSIATRQLRDCNVGTVKPTLLPSTLFPSFPVTLCARIIVSSSASKFLVTSSGSNSKYLRSRFVRVTKRADQVYRHVRTVSCLVRVFRNDAVDTAGYSLVTKVALRLPCSRVLREIFGISGCQELCSSLGYTYILRSLKFRAERNQWLF